MGCCCSHPPAQQDAQLQRADDLFRARLAAQAGKPEGAGAGSGGPRVSTSARDAGQEGAVASPSPEDVVGEDEMLEYRVRLFDMKGRNLDKRDMFSTDPYLIVKWGERTLQGSVMPSNTNPMWPDDFQFLYRCTLRQLARDTIRIQCFNYNKVTRHTLIGAVTLNMYDTATGPVHHDHQLSKEGGGPAGRVTFNCSMELYSKWQVQPLRITVFMGDEMRHPHGLAHTDMDHPVPDVLQDATAGAQMSASAVVAPPVRSPTMAGSVRPREFLLRYTKSTGETGVTMVEARTRRVDPDFDLAGADSEDGESAATAAPAGASTPKRARTIAMATPRPSAHPVESAVGTPLHQHSGLQRSLSHDGRVVAAKHKRTPPALATRAAESTFASGSGTAAAAAAAAAAGDASVDAASSERGAGWAEDDGEVKVGEHSRRSAPAVAAGAGRRVGDGDEVEAAPPVESAVADSTDSDSAALLPDDAPAAHAEQEDGAGTASNGDSEDAASASLVVDAAGNVTEQAEPRPAPQMEWLEPELPRLLQSGTFSDLLSRSIRLQVWCLEEGGGSRELLAGECWFAMEQLWDRAVPCEQPHVRESVAQSALWLRGRRVGEAEAVIRFLNGPRGPQQLLSGVMSEHGVTSSSSVVVGPKRAMGLFGSRKQRRVKRLEQIVAAFEVRRAAAAPPVVSAAACTMPHARSRAAPRAAHTHTGADPGHGPAAARR